MVSGRSGKESEVGWGGISGSAGGRRLGSGRGGVLEAGGGKD